MKTIIPALILVMLLLAATGCTGQQAKPAATTPPATPSAAVTEVPTETETPEPAEPAPVPTDIRTTAAITETPANVSATATPWSSATFSSTRNLVIYIRNNTYDPDSLAVLPGTMVTWINDDTTVHVVKATGDSAGKFTSAELVKGARFNYDFGEKTGIYEFTDPAYPEMRGAIIVRKGDTLTSISGSS